MKKRYSIHYFTISILMIVMISPSLGGPDDLGGKKDIQAPSVDFTVRTVTAGGPYSPKNVLAIWVEDSNGVFVKTRKLRANARKQHLVRWVASSNNNVVDAITGSTLTSHTTHTVSWDCKDMNGNIVPDGTYTMNVEFTDRNSASTGQPDGPTTSITFIKGSTSQNITPLDETYFKDISLSFDPGIGVGLQEIQADVQVSYKAYPNPFASRLIISCAFSENTKFDLSVYSVDGALIENIFNGNVLGGIHQYYWNSENCNAGIYILKATANGAKQGWSVVKLGN